MTQLCTAQGCRIRGRHLPACDNERCAGCLPRATSDGFICDPCLGRAAAQLEAIADLAADARDVAHRLGSSQGVGGSGKPGSRLPLDLGALARLDGVQNALGSWVRHVVEERGIHPPNTPPGFDVIAPSARFLLDQLPWARHRPEVSELLRDVAASVRIVRGILDPAREQKYLGPCGAVHAMPDPLDDNAEPFVSDPCEGDVYGRAGAETGTCRTCEATVNQADRLVWIDEVRREWLYHASEIADAYPNIKVDTIRTWLHRGQLTAHGEHDGRPLLKLGEVLDLAAESAARREEARARRAAKAVHSV